MRNIFKFSKSLNKETLSEEELIKRAIKGDSYCFEILLKTYKVYLYKIAYSYTKNEQDSLDLIQECACKSWLNINKLRNHSSFKSWISKILVNIAITSYYKAEKTEPIDSEYDIKDVDISTPIEEKVDLRNAIDLLRPEYRTAVMLKYFEDMTIDEIAQIMDLSSNTVKTYLRRAKICMKNTLREDYLYEK